MESRFDIVVLGVTGFTGSYIVRAIAASPLFKDKSIAVAGRSEAKVRATLKVIAEEIGVPAVSSYPIIVADTKDEESLAAMARQAKLIINAVGPYRLHGEAVVRAAILNGTNHIDVAGEPAFLESIDMKYSELAREKGVYVVGACGWDSIPCDLGTDFLKRNFDGTLGYVESFVKKNLGPSGYSFSSTSYDTLIMGISPNDDNLGQMRKTIMPDRLPGATHHPPRRGLMWKINEEHLKGWVLPFPGADKSIVQRSQYYDYKMNGKRPFQISTYFSFGSFSSALFLATWASAFAFLCKYEWTRKFLEAHPELCSFYMFNEVGPTKQQMAEASFEYYFFGRGWADGDRADETTPTRRATAVCRGPDPGYIGTAACVASAALTLLNDGDRLPKEGGVYTTASAFRDTRIFDYLESFGITFEMIPERERSKL